MLVIGAKGHAREVLDVLYEDPNLGNVHFFDNISKLKTDDLHGFKIITDFSDAKRFFLDEKEFCLGIGGTQIRKSLTQKFIAVGGYLVSIISNRALVSQKSKVGTGVNIMPFSSIFNEARIEEGVLVNSYASVHHNSFIGEYSELAPGSRVLGGCRIGKMCMIGANSVILPNIEIRDNVFIGAGAVVTKNIYEEGVYIGIPAKKII